MKERRERESKRERNGERKTDERENLTKRVRDMREKERQMR